MMFGFAETGEVGGGGGIRRGFVEEELMVFRI